MTKRFGLAAAITAGAWVAWEVLRRSSWMDLRGKVVLITGGSRGLGLQMAREFGARGAIVVICARNEEELNRAKQDLLERDIAVNAIPCDVTRQEDAEAMVKNTIRRFGRIDVLVNNAGIIQVGPISEMTVRDFETAMAVIFWGTLYPTLAALPEMRARGQGRIVNITSVGGKVSVPHLVPYSCAKFAAVALSEGLRAELAPCGVKVITIVPGLMRTGSHLNAVFKGDALKEYAWFSLAAASPLLSIHAERAARSIVRATIRGDAEKILSIPADLAARFHGVFPGVTALVSALVSRMLPGGSDGHSQHTTGQQARLALNSRLLEVANAAGQSAAEVLNQINA